MITETRGKPESPTVVHDYAPRTWGWEQKDREFKASLSYRMSLRPAELHDTVPKQVSWRFGYPRSSVGGKYEVAL